MQVAFYKGTRPGWQGIYSRAVRLIDRGPYSHVELVFSDGMAASASFIDKGVRIKKIDFDPARWDFVPVPWANEEKARAWFVQNQGMPYDILGNARFVFGFLPDSDHAAFCSEATAQALGFKDGWRLGPNGLFAVLNGPWQTACVPAHA